MSALRYIIDACNLMFHDRRMEETLERQGFQAAQTLLISVLSRFAQDAQLKEIVAVFDGSEKGAHLPRQKKESSGKILLIYANPRSDADRVIIEMAEDARRPGEITVVSGDKFIIRNVQRAGAHVLGCGAFLRRVKQANKQAADPFDGEDPRKFNGMSPREVEEWAKYFGFEE